MTELHFILSFLRSICEYVPRDIATMNFRCVTHLYCKNSIEHISSTLTRLHHEDAANDTLYLF